MRQAQILLNSGNLSCGVSQPHQEVPGGRGVGSASWARRAAHLPGSLSLSCGPHVPCHGGLESCITCRRLCVGGYCP